MGKKGAMRVNRVSAHWLVAATVFVGLANYGANADVVQLNGGYHAQVTNYFCAAASLEMAMDVPAVTGPNTEVAGLIAAGDGPTLRGGTPTPLAGINVVNGVGTVTPGSAQAFIYGLNHGLNTVNGFGYFNPFSPVGSGTDSQGLDVAANLLDNPNVNGVGNAFGFGSHQYAGYNMTNQGRANRTIANALSQFSVPAVAAINNGTHAISVYGVETNGAIAPNQNYQVTGFYVHDPWTGWAVQQLAGGVFNPAKINSQGGIGLGYNTFVAFGAGASYTIDPGTGNRINVGMKIKPWNRVFNVSPGQITPNGQWLNPGYKFEVEPQGPELPDTGDPAGDDGIPALTPDLGSAIAAAGTADSDALSDLSADSTLQSDVELPGGSFDVADAIMMQAPGESGPEGDWMIPYDGSGGSNDVTGAVMIDAETGAIDEATWINPNDPNEAPFTLPEIDLLFSDEENGILPEGNVPEPAALVMMLPAIAMLRRKRG